MTQAQIEELIEDTRKLPHANDKVALATSLGVLEIARQLMILNANRGGKGKKKAGKK